MEDIICKMVAGFLEPLSTGAKQALIIGILKECSPHFSEGELRVVLREAGFIPNVQAQIQDQLDFVGDILPDKKREALEGFLREFAV